jgi:hypothetical protein
MIITFNFNFSRFNQQLSDTLETKTPGQEYFLNIQYTEKSNIACYDFHIKNPHLFVGGFMSYLRYLCLFTYCGVQHISVSPGVCRRIHVLFTLFVFVYVLWCPTHICISRCL